MQLLFRINADILAALASDILKVIISIHDTYYILNWVSDPNPTEKGLSLPSDG